RLLAKSLVNGFKKNGGTIMEGKASLKKGSNHVAIAVNGDEISADQIIVASGAWTNELLKPLGFRINLEPQKGQIVHLSVDQDTSEWPVILPQDSSHYIVAFDDNRIAFGATREENSGFDY